MSHEGPQLPTLVKGRRLRAAIIGLSQSPGLLKKLEGSELEIVAVADFDLKPAAVKELREKGIFVSEDYTEVLDRRDLDLILNLIPDETVEAIIHQLRPEGAEVVHSSPASFLRSFSHAYVVRKGLTGVVEELSRFMAGLSDHGTFLDGLLRTTMELAGFQGAGLWSREGEHFTAVKCVDLPASLNAWRPRLGTGGPFDRLMEEGGILTVTDFDSGAGHGSAKACLDSGFRRLALLPVPRWGEPRAAVVLFGREPSPLPRDLVPILEKLTDILARVSGREKGRMEAREALIRDESTGLFNAAHFMERLEAEIRRSNRSEHPFSLLYLHTQSLPGLSHPDKGVSGAPSMAVAQEVMACVRDIDIPARYRENDFVVMLPHTPSPAAWLAAQRILRRISDVRPDGVGSGAALVSIGIASYPEHAARPKELVDKAEMAALLAARDGGGRIRIFPAGQAPGSEPTAEAIIREYPMLSDLFRLLEAQGLKDHGTFLHAMEVAHYASVMGRELGLSGAKLKELELAGWLHDVGKMTIPALGGGAETDLSRLSALSKMIHPVVGAYMLKGMIGSHSLSKAVLYHHARFDGSGGRQGPRGEDIPIEARIIAVADAYQHLKQLLRVEHRLSQSDLFQGLRKKAGGELDPALVECLIRGVAGE
jgi:diguanylate cyclase (GGDEF)-like protein/putative nucleotidyltransferase with HDIG domain